MSCHACGEPLPPKSRFCPGCGTPVPPREETVRRKVVTVMFADVVGSTALGEQTEPEVLQRMMTAHAVLAREIIEAAEAAARTAHKAVCQTDMVFDHAEVLLELADILRQQGRLAEALAFITEAGTLARVKKSALLDAQVACTSARMP